MEYFEKYTSNTVAGSGNQFYFTGDKEEVITGRIFYKITAGGRFNYSLLFSNVIDSTYSDGSISRKNLVCAEWKIIDARIARVDKNAVPNSFCDDAVATKINLSVSDFKQLTFDGKAEKFVAPGEFFNTDPIEMEFFRNDYLCLEITFKGEMIPYHEESLLPVFRRNGNGWAYDRRVPFPGMIGCDRKVKARIGFLGDSITQGIGTNLNSYKHWNALISEKLGDEYAFWNLGIGFGRANDMASDGAWLYKAKNNDIVFLCCGVNDSLQGFSAEEIIRDINIVVDILNSAGARVILQTLPPFDYQGENITKWQTVNEFLLTKMKDKVELVFDNVPVLRESADKPFSAQKYGGHPNEEGCRVWADALFEAIKDVI